MTVTVTDAGAVRTIRFDRPEAMNALDQATQLALRDAVQAAAEDASVRCVLLTGTGQRAFCVGLDLSEHATRLRAGGGSDAEGVATILRAQLNPTALTLATMAKPVVVAVNGAAAGAGLSLALAGDVRVMSADAVLNTAFTAIGLSIDSGLSWWLPRIVGMATAKDLVLRPRSVGAAEALELGLVDEVVPAEEAVARATQRARELAEGPTAAYGAARRAVVAAAGSSLAQALESEADLMGTPVRSADHASAVAAFLGKSTPTFRGR